MRLLYVLSFLAVAGCRPAEEYSGQRERPVQTDDANGTVKDEPTSNTPSQGCADADAASFVLFDAGGGKQPVCTFLSEAGADLALLVPVDDGCEDCSQAARTTADALRKEPGAIVVLVLPADASESTGLRLLADHADASDVVIMRDTDGIFEAKIAAQGLQWQDVSVYALGFDYASFLHELDVERLLAYIRTLLKIGASTFSWDGLANQGADDWSIE